MFLREPGQGFRRRPGPQTIDTLIGVADLKSGVAFIFATTNSPKPSDKTVEIRNKVTDLVFAELA